MTALAIAAFRRPYYLERQLDAWRRIRGMQHIESCTITLGHSPHIGQAREVIGRFADWADFKVTVLEDDPPEGHNKGIGHAIEAAFATGAEFVFFTDEDILPSDDIIEYLTWVQDWCNAPRIAVVNAHSEGGQGWDGPYVRDDPYADPAIVRLKPYFNMWGWGTWASRWHDLIRPAWDWDGRNRGCDWNMHSLLTRTGMLAVTPDASRTQHIGYREGLFANAATLAFSEAASFREHRDPVEFRCES